MKIKIKRCHPDAVLPTRSYESDAGMDLTAVDDGTPSVDGQYIEYNTGLSIELPAGYHSLIHPRSSISLKDLILANSIGLVDNMYRGQLICRFKVIPPVKVECMMVGGQKRWQAYTEGVFSYSEVERASWSPRLYKKGDRIAQLVIEKTISADIVEATDLTDTQRGEKGFGSSDKKGPKS